jgi:hypothetical protein
MQCLEPVHVDGARATEAAARMTRHVRKLISESTLIFRGRIVGARFVAQSPTERKMLLVAFEASEWKKGTGQGSLFVLYDSNCFDDCSNEEIEKGPQNHNEPAFYFIKTFDIEPQFTRLGIESLQRSLSLCEIELAKKPLLAQGTYFLSFGGFLYNLIVAGELEALPSGKPKP